MATEYLPYFELKEVGADGTFTGIASVYGVEDLGGDVISKGAFTKTIQENPTIPILWQHKSDEVIGEGTVSEWQGKLMLKGTLDMEDPAASKAYGKMKRKLIKGLSIGFTTVKSAFGEVEGRMVRNISELKLWEVSVVTFPMLPSAQVTRVKSADEQDAEIAELRKQILALQTKEGTPSEPPKVEEPPPPSTEPPIDHSVCINLIDAIRNLTKGQ